MKDFTNSHINANMQKGVQTYVGKLYFFEDGFEYVANAANSNIRFSKIQYKDIISIKPCKTIGIVPNGLKIKTKDTEYRFTITHRNAVIDYLNSKIN